MLSSNGARLKKSETVVMPCISIFALFTFKRVCGSFISKLFTSALSWLLTRFIDSFSRLKPETSLKLIFLILALRLSLLKALRDIFALMSLMSICLPLNLPGVRGVLSSSKRKLPRRIRMELKRKSMLGFCFKVSLEAKASITNWRFNGLSAVFFFRLRENPNKRTEVKTNLPFMSGRASKPAATCPASNSVSPSWSSR